MSCVNLVVLLIVVEPEISVLFIVPPSRSTRHDKYFVLDFINLILKTVMFWTQDLILE